MMWPYWGNQGCESSFSTFQIVHFYFYPTKEMKRGMRNVEGDEWQLRICGEKKDGLESRLLSQQRWEGRSQGAAEVLQHESCSRVWRRWSDAVISAGELWAVPATKALEISSSFQISEPKTRRQEEGTNNWENAQEHKLSRAAFSLRRTVNICSMLC